MTTIKCFGAFRLIQADARGAVHTDVCCEPCLAGDGHSAECDAVAAEAAAASRRLRRERRHAWRERQHGDITLDGQLPRQDPTRGRGRGGGVAAAASGWSSVNEGAGGLDEADGWADDGDDEQECWSSVTAAADRAAAEHDDKWTLEALTAFTLLI